MHHVIGRGIERKKIFFNDTDRSDFIDRLTDLVEEGAMDVYISLGELCSGSRRRVILEARGSLSWTAVRELGYSGADVAGYLGVTNS